MLESQILLDMNAFARPQLWAWLAIAFAAGFLVWLLSPILAPFLFAAILAYILDPIVERMTLLMHEAQGVGLAATQVGVLRRLFVFAHEDEDLVLVNPVITERSKEVEVDDEGCLSLRDVLVPVERATRVTIEGVDAANAPVRLELELPTARIVQHELDHLDGVLIIDRTDDESRRGALARLRPQPVLGAR
jgi:peptide deformylase